MEKIKCLFSLKAYLIIRHAKGCKAPSTRNIEGPQQIPVPFPSILSDAPQNCANDLITHAFIAHLSVHRENCFVGNCHHLLIQHVVP